MNVIIILQYISFWIPRLCSKQMENHITCTGKQSFKVFLQASVIFALKYFWPWSLDHIELHLCNVWLLVHNIFRHWRRFTDQKYCTFAFAFRTWATNDTKTTLRHQIILWFPNFCVIHDKFQISGLQNKQTKVRCSTSPGHTGCPAWGKWFPAAHSLCCGPALRCWPQGHLVTHLPGCVRHWFPF